MKKSRRSGNRTIIFKVNYLGTLGTGLKREISRTIEFKETQTLADLHKAIQEAVGWKDPHLYSFFMDGKLWGWDLDQEYTSPSLYKALHGKRAMLPVDFMWYPTESFLWSMERRPRSADTQIKKLALRKGRRFLYLFDFGDQHHFKIKVVGFGEVMRGEKYPKLLESTGRSPAQYPREG